MLSDAMAAFDLDGRVAVVTGGAGFLGRSFSGTLAAAGSRVVVADIAGEAAESTAGSIGSNALAVEVDVSDPGSVQSLVKSVLDAFGRLDILVNSAAVDAKFDPEHREQHATAFEEYSLELWEQSMAVNLTGAFLCSQAAAKQMVAQGAGVIVNICSTYGLVGPDQRIYESEERPTQYKPVDYSVTKAGVLGLTRYLATYFAGKNIRVNALSPGGVYNEHDDDFVRNYSSRTVLGRMAKPDELNGALLFLASDASSYMTGANLVVDGGWTAW